jgi:hypothetical protein
MATHIGKPMALAFISLGVCSAALTAQKPAQQLDLKGETLGESLEAFKKAHPGARCWKTELERVVEVGEDYCAVHRGISFAALPAVVDEDCDQIEAKVGDGHNCWEGLSANFRHGKLIQLTYSVEAEGGPEFALKQVLSALTEKFGKPEHTVNALQFDRMKPAWSRGNEILFVLAQELPVGQGKPKVNVISVTLGANENSAKKDI